MGPLSESLKFTSNPSVSSNGRATCISCSENAAFSNLSDMNDLPCPKTNRWNQIIQGNFGVYSNEADVNSFVRMVIVDILEALDIREKVTVRAEVEIMSNRPDFMLILVNGHPIGTIAGKQRDVAMSHKNISGGGV
jgi:hypothetical protein